MIKEEDSQSSSSSNSSSSSSSSSTSSEERAKKAKRLAEQARRKSYMPRGSVTVPNKRMQQIEEASSSRESSANLEQSLTRRARPRGQSRVDSFRTEDSLSQHIHNTQGTDEFEDFGPRLRLHSKKKQQQQQQRRRLSNFRNEPIQESVDESMLDDYEEEDLSLSMTECQEEAHELLNDIIHEQEAMLQRITNEHDEFLSKSSSAYSIGSDLNDAQVVSLNVYRILGLP